MIETLNEVVGRISAAGHAGVSDRTLVVFTTENGRYFTPNAEDMPATSAYLFPPAKAPFTKRELVCHRSSPGVAR